MACLSHKKKKVNGKKENKTIQHIKSAIRRMHIAQWQESATRQWNAFFLKKKFCSDLPISRRNCVCTLQMLCQMRFPSIEIVYLIIMQTYQFVAIIIVTRIINQVLCALAHVLQFIHPLCNTAYTLVGCATQATDNGWTQILHTCIPNNQWITNSPSSRQWSYASLFCCDNFWTIKMSCFSIIYYVRRREGAESRIVFIVK